MKLLLMFLYLVGKEISDSSSVHIYHSVRLKRWQPLNETFQYINPFTITINQHKYEQYVAGIFCIIGEPKFESMALSIERCDLDTVRCQHFSLLKIPKLETFFYNKNAPWSQFTSSFHPRMQFPTPRKGWYTITNATLNADTFVSMQPDMINYHWKTNSFIYDKEKKLQAAVAIDFVILRFVERDRKIKTQASSGRTT